MNGPEVEAVEAAPNLDGWPKLRRAVLGELCEAGRGGQLLCASQVAAKLAKHGESQRRVTAALGKLAELGEVQAPTVRGGGWIPRYDADGEPLVWALRSAVPSYGSVQRALIGAAGWCTGSQDNGTLVVDAGPVVLRLERVRGGWAWTLTGWALEYLRKLGEDLGPVEGLAQCLAEVEDAAERWQDVAALADATWAERNGGPPNAEAREAALAVLRAS
jgi:hypothetical protein